MPLTKVFPAPPTNNELTPLQRAQLLRKAKKIEQLLGATPHLVDITATDALGPIHISLPYRQASVSGRRSSLDSTVSRSSARTLKRSLSAASSSGYSNKLILQRSPSRTSTNYSLNNDKVPILKLAIDSLTLNPPSNRTSLADSALTYSRCNSPEDVVDDERATRNTCRSPRNSLVLEHNFIIPTPNSLRKQKMDRLRKKLGGDVPYQLVFPNGPCAEDTPPTAAASSISLLPNVDKPCPPLPPPLTPRARKHAGPRIAHARDSIVDAASIHRARRQVHVAPHPRPAMRRQGSLASTDFGRVKHRLSFIIENPDEHKAALFNEYALQVTRVSSGDGADVISEWFGANVNFWTGGKGDENASELNRRPSSYRKPPPPVPAEYLDSQ